MMNVGSTDGSLMLPKPLRRKAAVLAAVCLASMSWGGSGALAKEYPNSLPNVNVAPLGRSVEGNEHGPSLADLGRPELMLPARETVNPDELEAYDAVVFRQNCYRARPGVDNYFAALLASPIPADLYLNMGAYYRTRGEFPGSFSHLDREWADCVRASYMGRHSIGHCLTYISHGGRPEAVLAIFEQRDDNLTPEELRAAQYVRNFVDGKITQADRKYALARYGARGTVEFNGILGLMTIVIRNYAALSPQNESEFPPTEKAIAIINEVIAGKRMVPNPRQRVPSYPLDPRKC